jgi:hypothetical protein
LLVEEAMLEFAVALVVLGGAAVFVAGEAVVIQADFADGDDLGVAGQGAEVGADVLGSLGGVGGDPADGGIERGVLIRKGDRLPAGVKVRADRHDAGDPGSLGAFEDGWQVLRERRVIEVGVGVEEGGH